MPGFLINENDPRRETFFGSVVKIVKKGTNTVKSGIDAVKDVGVDAIKDIGSSGAGIVKNPVSVDLFNRDTYGELGEWFYEASFIEAGAGSVKDVGVGAVKSGVHKANVVVETGKQLVANNPPDCGPIVEEAVRKANAHLNNVNNEIKTTVFRISEVKSKLSECLKPVLCKSCPTCNTNACPVCPICQCPKCNLKLEWIPLMTGMAIGTIFVYMLV